MISLDMTRKFKKVGIGVESFTMENDILVLDIDMKDYDLTGKFVTAVFHPSTVETGNLAQVDGVIRLPISASQIREGINSIQLTFRWGTTSLEQSPVLIWKVQRSLVAGAPADTDVDLMTSLIAQVRAIADDENARQTAEAARVLVEADRVLAESGRALLEGDRIIAEEEREASENLREIAEGLRDTAEVDREFGETDRDFAEIDRAQSEGLRNTAEGNRVLAEEGRTLAEDGRVVQEGNRNLAETGRGTAEGARVTAEGTRVTAEEERDIAEGLRVLAEGTRILSEGERETAEDGRVLAENARETEASLREQAADPFKRMASTGLTFSYGVGAVRDMNVVTHVAAGSLSLTDNATNYMEVNLAGVVSIGTAGYTKDGIPLYAIVTVGGAITSVTDDRAFISAGGGTFIDLKDTPEVYTGQKRKVVTVNVAENGVEFVQALTAWQAGGSIIEDFEDGHVINPLVLNGWSIVDAGYNLSAKRLYALSSNSVLIDYSIPLIMIADGEVSFWHRQVTNGGAYNGYTGLKVLLDGLQVFSTRGNNLETWRQHTLVVPAGNHVLKFSRDTTNTLAVSELSIDDIKIPANGIYNMDAVLQNPGKLLAVAEDGSHVGFLPKDAYADKEQVAEDFRVNPFRPISQEGLNFAYGKGTLRNANVVTHTTAGSVLLEDNAVNYIEVDGEGSVLVNQVAYTKKMIPLYKVTTALGVITEVFDDRSFFNTATGSGMETMVSLLFGTGIMVSSSVISKV